MADAQVKLDWAGEGLRFQADHPSHNTFLIDGDGVTSHSPVQALVLSLAGCTAADVVDIVKKMRLPMSALAVVVEYDRNQEHPRYLTKVHMRFTTRGVAEADRDKVERAI